MIKNLPFSEVVDLAALVECQAGRVVSRTLAQNSKVTVTLFAFTAGEGLSPHTASGDAFVYVLDGETLITIDNQEMTLSAGQSVVMPANVLHAVAAKTDFKMLLVIIKPEDA
ncbi:MAG: cupin domain-containing protein [Candidatus Competibacteraceae bacterium]|jgi:quercetin dioxygenase-like cupin family protein|nr:MAG: cupin domain-containing protein [Candidatus Competibacteraceae bacterium]